MSGGKVLPLRRGSPAPGTSPADTGARADEHALITAVGNGDRAAFAELYDRFADDVAKFARRLGYLRDDEAEDLVHDTFIAALKAARKFEGRAKARTWLLGIAGNVARMRARTDIRGRDRAERMHRTRVTEPLRAPDDVAIDREVLGALTLALKRLPHDARVAFVLCDVEGVSGVDAAKALGVPTGTLYRRLHDARRALRDVLEVSL